MLGRMFLCLSQTWLNDVKTNIGLSPTIGFLNENDSLAYFESWQEWSSCLSFTVGFLKTFKFSLIISWLFQGARKDIPRNTLMFQLA